jgi:F-type H+-transporting ATPase subunit epsilon
MNSIHVDVVSAEESIFSGEAKFVALPGEAGELGILPGHVPLISRIKPGSVRIELKDGGEELVFVAGGVLEVQPHKVTVLSDTAIRGGDLDEARATEARRQAEEALRNAKSEVEVATAQAELAVMAA